MDDAGCAGCGLRAAGSDGDATLFTQCVPNPPTRPPSKQDRLSREKGKNARLWGQSPAVSKSRRLQSPAAARYRDLEMLHHAAYTLDDVGGVGSVPRDACYHALPDTWPDLRPSI